MIYTIYILSIYIIYTLSIHDLYIIYIDQYCYNRYVFYHVTVSFLHKNIIYIYTHIHTYVRTYIGTLHRRKTSSLRAPFGPSHRTTSIPPQWQPSAAPLQPPPGWEHLEISLAAGAHLPYSIIYICMVYPLTAVNFRTSLFVIIFFWAKSWYISCSSWPTRIGKHRLLGAQWGYPNSWMVSGKSNGWSAFSPWTWQVEGENYPVFRPL